MSRRTLCRSSVSGELRTSGRCLGRATGGRPSGLAYRSLANHGRKHLDRDDPVIRAAMEEELAQAARIHQLGVRYEIERRLMLDLAIKTYFDLLSCDKIRLGKV